MQILIRVFGIIGIILCIIPFQFKKYKNIILCKMVSELSFGVQYLLMGLVGTPGAYTGVLIDGVSGGRNFLYHKLNEKGKLTACKKPRKADNSYSACVLYARISANRKSRKGKLLQRLCFKRLCG